MQAAEGVAGGVVIEFGESANGSPTRVGVAIFTRQGERAMRTPSDLPLCSSRRSEKSSQDKQQSPVPPHMDSEFAGSSPSGVFSQGAGLSKPMA